MTVLAAVAAWLGTAFEQRHAAVPAPNRDRLVDAPFSGPTFTTRRWTVAER